MIHLSTFEFCKTYRLFFQVFEKIVIDTAVYGPDVGDRVSGGVGGNLVVEDALAHNFRPVIGDASKRKESILMIVVRVVVARCIEELSVHAHRAGSAPGAEGNEIAAKIKILSCQSLLEESAVVDAGGPQGPGVDGKIHIGTQEIGIDIAVAIVRCRTVV